LALPFPLPPPQADIPAHTKSANNPKMAHLARRLNPPKNNATASTVPPGENQNKIFVRFSALDDATVLAVSVKFLGAAPLRVTEAGFKLQVGILLTTVMAVVTLHVRFTTPLNPFVPATLTCTVFPEVEPCATIMDVGQFGPIAKPGGGRLIE
jgi:hypothetical protein